MLGTSADVWTHLSPSCHCLAALHAGHLGCQVLADHPRSLSPGQAVYAGTQSGVCGHFLMVVDGQQLAGKLWVAMWEVLGMICPPEAGGY